MIVAALLFVFITFPSFKFAVSLTLHIQRQEQEQIVINKFSDDLYGESIMINNKLLRERMERQQVELLNYKPLLNQIQVPLQEKYDNDLENIKIVERAYNKARTVYCPPCDLIPYFNCTVCHHNPKEDSYASFGIEPDFTVGKYAYNEAKNTAAFVGHSHVEKTVWLTFRGTQMFSISNWLTDLNVLYTSLDGRLKDVNVHQGMYDAYTAVKDYVIPALLSLRKLFPHYKFGISGHSLGGGLAAIAASDLWLNHSIPIDYFITFGQPRVGDYGFVKWWNKAFKNTFVRRVTHATDGVPHTLPFGGYMHYGPELWQRDENFSNNLLCHDGEDSKCSSSQIPLFSALHDHLFYLNVTVGSNVCLVNNYKSIE